MSPMVFENPQAAHGGQACLLDRDGRIVWVNDAWGQPDDSPFSGIHVGEDYLNSLSVDAGSESPTALVTREDMGDLLAGRREALEFELTWGARVGPPLEFLVRGQSFSFDGRRCAFVWHEDVGVARRAQAKLQSSEERYQQFFEAAPDAVFLLRGTGENVGEILDANSMACRMHGYTSAELIGMNIKQLDAPGDAGRVVERIQRLLRDGFIRFTVVHRRRDGSEFPCEVSARTAVFGGEACVVSFNRDISDQRRVAAELREQQVRLGLAARVSQVGFWDWDLLANKTFFSPEWKAQIGYGPDELANDFSTWEGRLHPSDLPQVQSAVQDHLDGKTPVYLVEFRLRHKDGSYRWIYVRGEAMRDDDGKPYRFVGCHVDITERRTAEIEREALRRRLDQLHRLEAMGTLASGIAHDFNNILSIISGNIELALLDCPEDSEVRESLKEIEQAGKRAGALVSQVLAFGGNEVPVRGPVSFGPVLTEATRMLRATIPQTIEIRCVVEDNVPDVIADPGQLHQVLINLGVNAWHAIGDRKGLITLCAHRLPGCETATDPVERQERVQIEVIDNGAGMSPEEQERIFEPFFTTKSSGQGTGLGLSVVHGIVCSHGGSITASSRVGRGSTFRFALPVAPAEGASVVAHSPASHDNTHILILDDEPELLRMLSRGLSVLGCEVTTFSRPEDAIERIGAGVRCDVFVTDFDMPEMHGIEVARRALAIVPALPIVLCSGFLTQESTVEALDVGVARVVGKPVVPSELLKVVGELLESPP